MRVTNGIPLGWILASYRCYRKFRPNTEGPGCATHRTTLPSAYAYRPIRCWSVIVLCADIGSCCPCFCNGALGVPLLQSVMVTLQRPFPAGVCHSVQNSIVAGGPDDPGDPWDQIPAAAVLLVRSGAVLGMIC
jgi:hypothetical protein